jgi:hypothetical protein
MERLDLGLLWSGFKHRSSGAHVGKVRHVAGKVTEIAASSHHSFEDAIAQGIARAEKTRKDIGGAWIAEQKVAVETGKVIEYRETMRVTFVLQD